MKLKAIIEAVSKQYQSVAKVRESFIADGTVKKDEFTRLLKRLDDLDVNPVTIGDKKHISGLKLKDGLPNLYDLFFDACQNELYEDSPESFMYASSFRRLQGKMQLLGIKPDQFFRNRLTHSLEVAQIARSIAYELGYSQEESFVVEAGALAHDIGNPPFGHSGERKLHELFEHAGGFEGNADKV